MKFIISAFSVQRSWFKMDFLNPSEILKQLKLRKNMVAADFGCGSGGWAIPLAKKLEGGKVYAIDILEEPLSALKARAKLEKIFNIETIKADVEKTSRLFNDSCDLVLMTNLLFQVQSTPGVDRKISGIKQVLEEGKRVLKERGEILMVDWQEEAEIGPEKKVSIEEVKKMAEKLGLKIEKEFEAGTYHWALILVKPD